MRVLITGGSGFIGSNLVSNLEKFCDVTFVDKQKSIFNHASKEITADFSDNTILEMISNKKFDYVFHLAATSKVQETVDFPLLSHSNNVLKTIQLLSVCAQNTKRVINISSSAVYGNNLSLSGMSEVDIPDPQSPYALQKLNTEQYCKLFSEIYGLEAISIRPFNVFGPNQLGNNKYACVISSWLNDIKNKTPIKLEGTGQQRRDFIYIDDMIDIIKLAAFADIDKNEVVNAGTGKSISLIEILKMIFHMNFNISNLPERSNDVFETRANITKQKLLLGKTKYISFEDGLSRTIDWYMNNKT